MRGGEGEARHSPTFVIERRLDATGEFESYREILPRAKARGSRRIRIFPGDSHRAKARGYETTYPGVARRFVASGLPPMTRRPERSGRAGRERRRTKLAGVLPRAPTRGYEAMIPRGISPGEGPVYGSGRSSTMAPGGRGESSGSRRARRNCEVAGSTKGSTLWTVVSTGGASCGDPTDRSGTSCPAS